jgi:aspartate racemase
LAEPCTRLVGLIGGLGPESTVDYYKLIIQKYQERITDGSYPRMIIDSLDVNKMIAWIAAGEHQAATEYLVSSAARLASAGADFLVIAANTPHLYYTPVAKLAPLPMVSIVTAACAAVKAAGYSRVGLLGTRFTMTGQFYPEVFERERIALVTPTPEEIDYIHEKYLGELLKGVFLDATRDRLAEMARRLVRDERLDALLLAGTELPLILRGVEFDVPLLDTAIIHVDAIIDRLLTP